MEAVARRTEGDNLEPKTIRIYAGDSSDGSPVFEELPVAETDPGVYCLLSSPGLVLGVARGDLIRLDSGDGRFELIRRGGNICIQLYVTPAMEKSVGELITRVTEDLDGTLDGRTPKQVVFSVPSSSGFDAIEKVFNSFTATNRPAEWYFGNVYDERDGVTPLNWWR